MLTLASVQVATTPEWVGPAVAISLAILAGASAEQIVAGLVALVVGGILLLGS